MGLLETLGFKGKAEVTAQYAPAIMDSTYGAGMYSTGPADVYPTSLYGAILPEIMRRSPSAASIALLNVKCNICSISWSIRR